MAWLPTLPIAIEKNAKSKSCWLVYANQQLFWCIDDFDKTDSELFVDPVQNLKHGRGIFFSHGMSNDFSRGLIKNWSCCIVAIIDYDLADVIGQRLKVKLQPNNAMAINKALFF